MTALPRDRKSELVLSWSDVEDLVSVVASKLERAAPFSSIIPIVRGGFIPAVMLSHVTGTPIDPSYDPAWLGIPYLNARCVIVDDICDSGRTLTQIRKALPRSVTAVLCTHPDREGLVDVFGRLVDPDTWVVFPWERR